MQFQLTQLALVVIMTIFVHAEPGESLLARQGQCTPSKINFYHMYSFVISWSQGLGVRSYTVQWAPIAYESTQSAFPLFYTNQAVNSSLLSIVTWFNDG